MIKNWLTRKITRAHLQDFLVQHATTEQVLEIGASQNTLTTLFPNVFKTDIRPLPTLDGVCDAHRLPFADNSVAVILCTEVLEHCYAPHEAMSEFYRVLKPNGKLILSTRFVFPLHDVPHDYFRFTKYGLAHLARAFNQVTIQPEVGSVETIAVLLQRLGYQADWKLPLLKIGLFLWAKGVVWGQKLLRQEYGDIQHRQHETAILTSGYYLIAIK